MRRPPKGTVSGCKGEKFTWALPRLCVCSVTESCPTLQPCGLELASQASLSMELSRLEYWSGLPFLMPNNMFEDLITFPHRSTFHQHLMSHILMFCGGCCYHGNIWPLNTNSFFLFFLIYTCMLSIHFIVIPWTIARQAPLSMEFSRQEYWRR